jgi:hypothetical protein
MGRERKCRVALKSIADRYGNVQLLKRERRIAEDEQRRTAEALSIPSMIARTAGGATWPTVHFFRCRPDLAAAHAMNQPLERNC